MPWGGEASWFQKPVVTAELLFPFRGHSGALPRPRAPPAGFGVVGGLTWSSVGFLYFKPSSMKTETCDSPEVRHLPTVCARGAWHSVGSH